jgi:1-acyl-sn-glycerol-3-phosphate acyltransferase
MAEATTSGRLVLVLRALLFYTGLGVSTALIGPLVVLAWPLPFEFRYGLTRLWTGFNIRWLTLTCGVRYRISGLNNLPEGPVIVLSKHQSTWETLFLNWQLPPVAWVLKRELLWFPVFGWALAALEPIAINRKASSEAVSQILDQGKRHLDRGRWVLLFPEGTRSAPGQKLRYKLGGARLAAHTSYPVLPIAHNAGEFWRRRGLIKKPGTVDVVIGPLIHTRGLTAQQINERTEHWIETTMTRISHVAPTTTNDASVRSSEAG